VSRRDFKGATIEAWGDDVAGAVAAHAERENAGGWDLASFSVVSLAYNFEGSLRVRNRVAVVYSRRRDYDPNT
jgi:hypothetical protein